MASDSTSIVEYVWKWLKVNDLPNWCVLLFTGIVWPIFLYLWHRRKVSGIPGLEVQLAPARINIDGNDFDAIDIVFINHTSSVAYITDPQVRRCSTKFVVPIEASRDIGHDYHHMKFLDSASGKYTFREITLQTSASAKTCMAVTAPLSEEFYRYSASWVHRLLRMRRYFVIEYTAMVGKERYTVSIIF